MGRLNRIEPEEATGRVKEIFDKYLRERGNVPNAFKTIAQVPDYLTTLIDHYRTVMFTGQVPFKLKELLFVKVSQVNACRY